MVRAMTVAMFLAVVQAVAYPIGFSSTSTYSSSYPAGSSGSVSNWTGAAFDAANIGGSGTNADGRAGYTSNTATGSNVTSWNLNFTNGPIVLNVGKISGTSYTTMSMQCFLGAKMRNRGGSGSGNCYGNPFC